LYVLLTKYYLDNQVEKNEMGGAHSIDGGEERCMQGFGGETEGCRRRWEDNTTTDLQEFCWRAQSGSSWLRTGTVGGHM